jgi:hypothetical protein
MATILVVDHEREATVKAFKVDHEYDADICVFEHGTDRISHCRSLSSMKSSEVVRILEKAHMESEDIFDLKGLSVLGRATRRPMRHEVMRKINLSNR